MINEFYLLLIYKQAKIFNNTVFNNSTDDVADSVNADAMAGANNSSYCNIEIIGVMVKQLSSSRRNVIFHHAYLCCVFDSQCR